MNKHVVKFNRALDIFYQMVEQLDTDLTMLGIARMSSNEMYAYLEGLGYVYDDKEGWRLDDENL